MWYKRHIIGTLCESCTSAMTVSESNITEKALNGLSTYPVHKQIDCWIVLYQTSSSKIILRIAKTSCMITVGTDTSTIL